MNEQGLRVLNQGIEDISQLIAAIKELPEGSIEGLSNYDLSNVSLERDRIIIKRPRGHGDPLTVKFPEGSTHNVATYGMASFEYNGRIYEIHL